jgi:CBS domain-containing protein
MDKSFATIEGEIMRDAWHDCVPDGDREVERNLFTVVIDHGEEHHKSVVGIVDIRAVLDDMLPELTGGSRVRVSGVIHTPVKRGYGSEVISEFAYMEPETVAIISEDE